jgi:hypothetical protein
VSSVFWVLRVDGLEPSGFSSHGRRRPVGGRWELLIIANRWMLLRFIGKIRAYWDETGNELKKMDESPPPTGRLACDSRARTALSHRRLLKSKTPTPSRTRGDIKGSRDFPRAAGFQRVFRNTLWPGRCRRARLRLLSATSLLS